MRDLLIEALRNGVMIVLEPPPARLSPRGEPLYVIEASHERENARAKKTLKSGELERLPEVLRQLVAEVSPPPAAEDDLF